MRNMNLFPVKVGSILRPLTRQHYREPVSDRWHRCRVCLNNEIRWQFDGVFRSLTSSISVCMRQYRCIAKKLVIIILNKVL
jgi:hypothetical protein